MINSPEDISPANEATVLRMANQLDNRSATAKGAAWASRIMTVSLEMVVPGLIGYWLDTKLGTKFVLMLAGFVFGLTAAIKHLLYLTRKNSTQKNNRNLSNSQAKRSQDSKP